LKKSPWTTQVMAMFEDILGLVKRAKPAGPGAKFVADTLPTLSQFKDSTNAGRLARRASDPRLVLIDNKLGAYDAIRKDISKDKEKRTLIASMYRDVTVWLKQARGDDPTKQKRKPGVQDFRNKLHTHRLFPDYLK
jgi:hypothetical protein